MRTVSLTVDVWCRYYEGAPIYRVYVDSELLTERTFVWPSREQYIREHIKVNLFPGTHILTIENCSGPNCVFITNNMLVDGIASPTTFLV